MLKLHHIFFRNFTILFALTFLASLAVTYITIKESRIKVYHQFIHTIYKAHDTTFKTFNPLLIEQQLRFYDKYRLTIIHGDGHVIFDNESNIKSMDNHAQRPEVMMAQRQEYGDNVRYSPTLKIDMLYVCKMYRVGETVYYIRIAKELNELEKTLHDVWIKLGIIFALTFICAIFIAYVMSRKMAGQTQEIILYLDKLENKEYTARIQSRLSLEFYDITRKLNELARRLAKKEKIKNKYTAKLKLKNQQITGVIDAISHEFKNPIAAIVGYTETLHNDPEIDKRLLERFLGKIHTNAMAISGMIDRLSLSSKYENEALLPQYSQVEVKVLLDEVIATLSPKLKERSLSLYGELLESVYIDRAMIRLVFINLIDNAIKYSDGPIDVTVERCDTGVKCEIRDYGIGIEEEHIDKITQKFYRINKLTWDNSLGLGLNLVKMILKLHQSDLTISSIKGEGSSFSFILPQNTYKTTQDT